MEKLLTVSQLSAMMGVSRRTLYDWVHIGFIPHYKFPKGIRFRATDMEKWLKNRRRKGRITYKPQL